MNKIDIRTLQKDISAEGVLFIRAIEEKVSKNNKTYYMITFSDGDSELTGNYFDELKDFKNYKGKPVSVTIRTQVYNNKFSCIVNSINESNDLDEEILSTFVKYSSNKTTYELYKQELIDLINRIQDKEIKKLCQYVFTQEFRDEFLTYPAAKSNHHTGLGGLLEHSVNLAKVALYCAENYSYDLELDKDLLISGALFQDIGKTVEYKVDDMFNATYSKVGMLKGHITIGNEILYSALSDLGIDSEQDKFSRLSHIILSHHGLLEYGSPTFPSTPEAILISRIDKLDADMKAAITAVKSLLDEDEFTQRVFNLENVQLLKPNAIIYEKTVIIEKKSSVTEDSFEEGELF